LDRSGARYGGESGVGDEHVGSLVVPDHGVVVTATGTDDGQRKADHHVGLDRARDIGVRDHD
jgi:hypothetical protein